MPRVIALTKKLGGAQHPYPYRIVIEGKLEGADAAAVKQRIMDAIEGAAEQVPGASVLHVTTLRNGTSPGSKGRRPHQDEQKQLAALLACMTRYKWTNVEFNKRVEKLGLQEYARGRGVYPATPRSLDAGA